ncbi:MAG: hypothetical protein KGO48_15455 [Alphaproteobacteria bacterium]|nr:hypothetical protein [Alphaproteobacteria bacterium]
MAATLSDSTPDPGTVGPWLKGILRKLIPAIGINPWQAGVLTFSAYWGLPFILCLLQGTLIKREAAGQLALQIFPLQIHVPLIDRELNHFVAFQKLSGPYALAYMNDRTHFLFAVLLAAGAAVWMYAITELPQAVMKLHGDGVMRSSDIARTYEKYRERAYGRQGLIVSALFAIPAAGTFIVIGEHSNAVNWWGYAGYGYAGIAMSLMIGIMAFWGTRSLFILGYASLMLSRLLRSPLVLRPYHPDRCSGLAPVGVMIVFFWIYSASVALAIFVTMHFGYLQIERTPVAWGITLVAAIFLPVLAIAPLLSARNALSSAKRGVLAELEQPIARIWQRAMSDLENTGGGDVSSELSVASQVNEFYDLVDSTNVWPFPKQLTAAIFLANLLQFIGLAQTIIANTP